MKILLCVIGGCVGMFTGGALIEHTAWGLVPIGSAMVLGHVAWKLWTHR